MKSTIFHVKSAGFHILQQNELLGYHQVQVFHITKDQTTPYPPHPYPTTSMKLASLVMK